MVSARQHCHAFFKLDRVLGALAALTLVALPLAPTASASTRKLMPTVRALSRHSGPIAGGERMIVTGTNFVHVASVIFGKTNARARVLSKTRLQVTVPKHRAGSLHITVRTRYGVSKPGNASRYEFIAPPKLDARVASVTVGPLPTPIIPDGWSGPNPKAPCDGNGVVGLDYCGAILEGLAPLTLPANWTRLSDPLRGFVLINLERIERGEVPMVGISTTLDDDAAVGADAGTDPSVSPITDGVGGSIWSGGSFVQSAMPGWLFDDGPGGFNLDCTGTTTWGCFGHRDNILDYPTNSELAAGVADSPEGNSAAAVFSDEYTDFNFLWATELSAGYPQGLPTSFTLTPPTVTAVTTHGARMISITGANLDTGTTVFFSEVADADKLDCSTPDSCTVTVPSDLAANTIYNVSVVNPAGVSARNAADEYTTKPRRRHR
jgi:IPT/TIG domain